MSTLLSSPVGDKGSVAAPEIARDGRTDRRPEQLDGELTPCNAKLEMAKLCVARNEMNEIFTRTALDLPRKCFSFRPGVRRASLPLFILCAQSRELWHILKIRPAAAEHSTW